MTHKKIFSFFLFHTRKKAPKIAAGLLCFLLVVLPILMIIDSYPGAFPAKDRFSHPTFFLKSTKDQRSFHKMTESLFQSELKENTLGMHYTIANPEAFGIREYDAVLPLYTGNVPSKDAIPTNEAVDTLHRIHSETLSKEDAYAYLLLDHALSLTSRASAFELLDDPLSPHSGMQTQLLLLLSEYTFRSIRDVEDYFALLSQAGSYLNSLTEFEHQKIQEGFPPTKSTLQKTISQCETILDKEELELHTHFLQTTFDERLETLSKSISISEHTLALYRAQNDQLLKDILVPAYDALADKLLLLKEDCPDKLPEGLASQKGGRDYYELLFCLQTGSTFSHSALKENLLQTLSETSARLQQLTAAAPVRICPCEALPADPSQIISCLREYMQPAFPPFPLGTEDQVCLTIKEVAPNMTSYSAPAFYLTSPADEPDTNVIYINPKSTNSVLELFTTLAHEGYPGHLYQNVYFSKLFQKEGLDKSRLLLDYGGYTEGWAVYTEFMAYDYAYDYLIKAGASEDAHYALVEKESRKLLLCLYTLADLMIHYENAGLYQISELFLPYGIEDKETISSIYTYIAENPCNYPKYFIGYLEIMALKKQAQELWKTQYSELAFHSFILESGPSDFTSLKKRLINYQPS